MNIKFILLFVIFIYFIIKIFSHFNDNSKRQMSSILDKTLPKKTEYSRLQSWVHKSDELLYYTNNNHFTKIIDHISIFLEVYEKIKQNKNNIDVKQNYDIMYNNYIESINNYKYMKFNLPTDSHLHDLYRSQYIELLSIMNSYLMEVININNNDILVNGLRNYKSEINKDDLLSYT